MGDSRRFALAMVACAALSLAGCGDDEGNGYISGTTLPPIVGGTARAGFARDATLSPSGVVVNAFTDVFATDVDGRFRRIAIDDAEGAIIVAAKGGAFIEPATGVATAVLGNQFVAAALRVSQGGTRRIAISPVSDLAATLALTLSDVTGASAESAVRTANAAIAGYFDPGMAAPSSIEGAVLWDPLSPFDATSLTDDVVVGLITAGLSVQADANGVDLLTYTGILGFDAADGNADGRIHPPFTALQSESIAGAAALPAYPADPLGEDLALAIEEFLASAQNASDVDAALAAPLLARLRAGRGHILLGAPVITEVISPTAPGDRIVTINGNGFGFGAEVFFGEDPAKSVLPSSSLNTRHAELPDGFVSGTTVLVTVINTTGLRHSFEATITFAP